MAEALRGARELHSLILAEGIRDDPRVRAITTVATGRGLPVETVPRDLLDHLTHRANHQGIGLETGPYPYAPLDDIAARPATVLLLDHLQDPQNVGTLLRAAEAAGSAGVVIPQDRAADITPAVVNASAGAVEALRIARVPNLTRAAEDLKERGWWLAGLDTGDDAVDLFATDLPRPVALVVGAEGSGIAPNLRRRCDLILAIPMLGTVASLNAATAGAIALFDLVRRERAAAAT